MITGIIAFIILIAVVPTSVENGEWLVLAVGIAMALFFLVLGSASRESDRAYLNMVDYWAKGGPKKK